MEVNFQTYILCTLKHQGSTSAAGFLSELVTIIFICSSTNFQTVIAKVTKELQEKQVTKFKKNILYLYFNTVVGTFKEWLPAFELLEKETNVSNNPINMIKLDNKG